MKKINIGGDGKSVRDAVSTAPVKIANALPLTIVFVLITLAVVLYQNFLADKTVRPSAIVIDIQDSAQQEEDEVNGKNISRALDDSENLVILAQSLEKQYLSNLLNPAEVFNQAQIKLLNNKVKTYSVLAHMISSLMANRDYERSLALLKLYSNENRKEFSMSFYFAKCLSKTNSPEQAIEEYQVLLKNQPNHQRAVINLGLLLLQQRAYLDARKIFSSAVEFTSGVKKAKSFAGLADAEAGLNEFPNAIKYYKKSIEYRPTHSLTWRKLARAMRDENMSIAAVSASYDKAIAIDPGNTRVLLEYATYYLSQLEFKQAIPLLRKSLTFSRESISARLYLILCYLEHRRMANAAKQVGYLKKHVILRYHGEQANGLDFFIAKKYRESLSSFKSTLKKKRNNDFAYYMISRAYLQLEKPKNALTYLSKINRSSVLFNAARYRMVLANIELEQSDNALKLLTSLFERMPETHAIPYQTALLAYRQKNLKVASVAIEKAIQLNDESRSYLLLQARILWRSGQAEKAIDSLRNNLARNPRYKPALYRLADYQEKSGNLSLALESFQVLAAISRDYSDILFRIANLYAQNNNKEKSIDLLTEFLHSQSDNIDARLLYATNYCATSRYEKCRKQIEIILKFEPDNLLAAELSSRYL